MGELGAKTPPSIGEYVPVKTMAHALAFFKGIAYAHKPLTPIPKDSTGHAWLMWLIEGHYAYAEMCPKGVEYFHVHRNSDIGFYGDARGFSVVATGAGHSCAFSYKQALKGVPKSASEKVRIAFRHAIEYQVSYWRQQNFREGLLCPVFNRPLRLGDAHADHDPPFANLVENFCTQQHLTAEMIQIEDSWNEKQHVSWQLSEPLLSAWRAYHWQNMRLQFVSVSGHLELDHRRREQKRQQERAQDVFKSMRS